VQILDKAVGWFPITLGDTRKISIQMKFVPPSQGTQGGVGSRLISAPVTVQPGVPYRLTFWTSFDNRDAGFIGVMFNDVPYYTVDAGDHGYGTYIFYPNSFDYTPTNSTVTVKFEFLFTGNVPSLMLVDTVSLDLIQ